LFHQGINSLQFCQDVLVEIGTPGACITRSGELRTIEMFVEKDSS